MITGTWIPFAPKEYKELKLTKLEDAQPKNPNVSVTFLDKLKPQQDYCDAKFKNDDDNKNNG